MKHSEDWKEYPLRVAFRGLCYLLRARITTASNDVKSNVKQGFPGVEDAENAINTEKKSASFDDVLPKRKLKGRPPERPNGESGCFQLQLFAALPGKELLYIVK